MRRSRTSCRSRRSACSRGSGSNCGASSVRSPRAASRRTRRRGRPVRGHSPELLALLGSPAAAHPARAPDRRRSSPCSSGCAGGGSGRNGRRTSRSSATAHGGGVAAARGPARRTGRLSRRRPRPLPRHADGTGRAATRRLRPRADRPRISARGATAAMVAGRTAPPLRPPRRGDRLRGRALPCGGIRRGRAPSRTTCAAHHRWPQAVAA